MYTGGSSQSLDLLLSRFLHISTLLQLSLHHVRPSGSNALPGSLILYLYKTYCLPRSLLPMTLTFSSPCAA